MPKLNFVEYDPRGSEVPDPRGRREYISPHPRSLAEVERAAYDEDNVPDNGNRRRYNDPDNKGNLSDDLEGGRGGLQQKKPLAKSRQEQGGRK